VFNPNNAAIRGRFLGERYRHKPILWILGGHQFAGADEERHILEAMARGLREGDEGCHLVTFHPTGQYSEVFSPRAVHSIYFSIQQQETDGVK
jgi:hypothetical protein